MNIINLIFHRCGEHLEYIEGTRFPSEGCTGRGKVWYNYRCQVCGKMYTSCGHDLFRIKYPYETPMKKII